MIELCAANSLMIYSSSCYFFILDCRNFCKLIMNFSLSFLLTAHILLCCSFIRAQDDLMFGSVSCNYSGITVEVFPGDKFEGVIYARGNFFNPYCSYFPSPESTTQHKSFSLPLMDCGTHIQELNGSTYVSNTVIVQKHRNVQTRFDFEHNITCQLSHVNHLDITEFLSAKNIAHTFNNDTVKAWMDVKLGTDILGAEQSRKLFIGDKFLLVIHLKDGGVHRDIRIDSCWAYDGDSFEGSRYALHLHDGSSCETLGWLSEFRLMDGFLNIPDFLTYAVVQAFKFPTSNEVHIACSVRVCKYKCMDYCNYKGSEKSDETSRSKRSNTDNHSDNHIRSRYKLMKATVQALGAQLIESNKAHRPDRIAHSPEIKAHRADASLLRRRISKTVIPDTTEEITYETEANSNYDAINNSQSDDPRNSSKDFESGKDVFSNNVYTFNLTTTIVVFKGDEDYFKQNPESNQLRYCTINMIYFILMGSLCFIIFCLFVTCVGMALYLRKEKKRQKLNDFLLYQY